MLLVAGPLLETFPAAALGALVVYAALRLVDLDEFRRIGRFRRSELVLALVTCAGVIALDVLYGVLVAVALSALDLFRRVARPHDGILGSRRASRACTTSTTIRRRRRSLGWWSTAMTRRCSSPTPRISADGHWPPSTGPLNRFAGWC
jgi:MFS superfamily sulfate permease-like transporter